MISKVVRSTEYLLCLLHKLNWYYWAAFVCVGWKNPSKFGLVCIYLGKYVSGILHFLTARNSWIKFLTIYSIFCSGRRVVTTRGPMATDEGCDQLGHYLQRSNDWIVYLFIYQKWNTKKSQNHDFGGNDLVDVLHKPLSAWGPVHFGQEAVSVPVNRVESCKEALIVLFAFNFTTLIVRQQANFHNWALGANRGGNKMWLYVVT